jgi:hypothetical protein
LLKPLEAGFDSPYKEWVEAIEALQSKLSYQKPMNVDETIHGSLSLGFPHEVMAWYRVSRGKQDK